MATQSLVAQFATLPEGSPEEQAFLNLLLTIAQDELHEQCMARYEKEEFDAWDGRSDETFDRVLWERWIIELERWFDDRIDPLTNIKSWAAPMCFVRLAARECGVVPEAGLHMLKQEECPNQDAIYVTVYTGEWKGRTVFYVPGGKQFRFTRQEAVWDAEDQLLAGLQWLCTHAANCVRVRGYATSDCATPPLGDILRAQMCGS